MPAVDCDYYYYDFHRGWEKESCRLLESSPDPGRPWHRSLCNTCPVPRLLEITNCEHLVLEGKATRKLFGVRVQISFSMCSNSLEELDNPENCSACAQIQEDQFLEKGGQD